MPKAGEEVLGDPVASRGIKVGIGRFWSLFWARLSCSRLARQWWQTRAGSQGSWSSELRTIGAGLCRRSGEGETQDSPKPIGSGGILGTVRIGRSIRISKRIRVRGPVSVSPKWRCLLTSGLGVGEAGGWGSRVTCVTPPSFSPQVNDLEGLWGNFAEVMGKK